MKRILGFIIRNSFLILDSILENIYFLRMTLYLILVLFLIIYFLINLKPWKKSYRFFKDLFFNEERYKINLSSTYILESKFIENYIYKFYTEQIVSFIKTDYTFDDRVILTLSIYDDKIIDLTGYYKMFDNSICYNFFLNNVKPFVNIKYVDEGVIELSLTIYDI